jgi:hypothetical protein
MFDDIVHIFECHSDDERVIVPLMKTLERIFEKEEVQK